MELTRRELLRLGTGAGYLLLPKGSVFGMSSPPLTPFVDRLPIPPVLGQGDHFEIEMREAHQKLHRDLPPTRIWGYNGTFLGPTFEVRTGRPVTVRWQNELPDKQFLLSTTLSMARRKTCLTFAP